MSRLWRGWLVTILCLAASLGFAAISGSPIAFAAVGVGFVLGLVVGRIYALNRLRSGARPAADAPMPKRIPFLWLAASSGAIFSVIFGLVGLSRFQMGLAGVGLIALTAGAYFAIILSGAIDFAITRGPLSGAPRA